MTLRDLPHLALRLHGGVDAHGSAALGAVAERAGFRTVWFAENPFGRGVLPALAACALGTEGIRLGVGVFNPFNRHPTLMAMEVGALDEMAGGRVVLGVGSGLGARVRQMGHRYDRPVGAVRDAIAIARPLLRGEDVSYAGTVFAAHGVRLEFPLRRREVPILMAAMGDQALRLCGEVADGLMISNMCAPGYTVRALEIVRAAAEASGRPIQSSVRPFEVVQYVPCAVRDDDDEARHAVIPVLGRMLLHYWRHGGDAPSVRAAHLEHTGIDAGDFARAMERLAAGEAPALALDERFTAAYAIAGTVEHCLAQCAVYGRAGVTELGLSFVGEEAAAEIARLGRAARSAGSR